MAAFISAFNSCRLSGTSFPSSRASVRFTISPLYTPGMGSQMVFPPRRIRSIVELVKSAENAFALKSSTYSPASPLGMEVNTRS